MGMPVFEGAVTRAQIVEACKALGLNPETTVSINVAPDRVRVIETTDSRTGARRCYTLQVK